MPNLSRSRAVRRPRSVIWAFVRDLDNWAPLMPGYVAHAVESDTDSVWDLTGDLGPFSKTVKLRVQVTEWREPERVAFRLEGVDEAVTGTGTFDVAADGGPAPPPPPQPWWHRLWSWLLGRPPAILTTAEPGAATVDFTFTIEAQGPMGPLVNAMLGPYAERAAEGLLDAVGDRLEADAEEAA